MTNVFNEGKDYDPDACFDLVSRLIEECFKPVALNYTKTRTDKIIKIRQDFLTAPLVDKYYDTNISSVLFHPISLKRRLKKTFDNL